ncbi:MAG: DUF3798 domain-containing protein [Bacillota bacterium]|nr:DUF3798 domain-containing protein [Bacillota bacterium]MDW7677313.1 DUF3798 domain-containing protein [Bacillota bacterium]
MKEDLHEKSRAFVLILMMIFSMTGCGGSTPEQAAEPSEQNESPAETPTDSAYKIGFMTGTVSQNEEEYRAAENMQALYGGMIEISTYPDRFMQEQETTITNMMAMASDPHLKAIVMVQAVPGAAAAIARVREVRSEMMFILGTPGEDPERIKGCGYPVKGQTAEPGEPSLLLVFSGRMRCQGL